MTTFQLYDRVVSRIDLPDFGIQAGAVGTLVDHHPGGAFEVDFGLDADGDIVTAGLAADQLAPLPSVSTQAA